MTHPAAPTHADSSFPDASPPPATSPPTHADSSIPAGTAAAAASRPPAAVAASRPPAAVADSSIPADSRTLTDSSIPADSRTLTDSSIPAGGSRPADSPVPAAPDVISALAGVPAGGHIDALRDLRPAARRDAQLAYELLFHPADDGPLPLVDRLAIAVFVAGLHRHDAAIAHYRDALREAGAGTELRAAVYRETEAAAAPGPAGSYRESGLTAESVPVAEFRVSAESLEVLGERLSAGLEHARLLVLHPRDSRPERLEALTTAGWDEDGIVTLSQLVGYLSYQIRAAVGLAALAATLEDS